MIFIPFMEDKKYNVQDYIFHPEIYQRVKYLFLIIKLLERKENQIDQENPGKTKDKEMSLALAHIKTYYNDSQS